MKPSAQRSTLGLVFLTVFIDLAGFSVIFPLFPALLEHYLAREGPGSALARLVGWLDRFAGGDRNAVITLFGGVLGSVYSLLQFACAPLWGALSDRIGRRPTLLVTLTGTLLSYVLWTFAGSFALLVAARFAGGVMAGNIATAAAVVGDTTSGPQRARGMGIVGMAIGLGFILGPALGGLAAQWDLTGGVASGASLALHPFSGAALAAAGLAAINLLWAVARFPETLPPQRRGSGEARHGIAPLRRLRSLPAGVQRASAVFFLYLLAFSAMEFTLTFLAAERLGWGPAELTWMFVFVGLCIALVQGGIVRRVAPRYGERRVALTGLVLLMPGFALVGSARSGAQLYAGLACMAVGSALVMPCLSALVSRYASAERQGSALGSYQSAGSLARAAGPILGGLLYWKLGGAAPYWIGCAWLLVPIALARGLPPVPAAAEPATPAAGT